MGEIDELIIKHGMKRFGLSRDEITKQLQELVDAGLVLSGDDNFQLSSKGIEYVEKNIFKWKSKDDQFK